jgi:hypothetical protein
MTPSRSPQRKGAARHFLQNSNHPQVFRKKGAAPFHLSQSSRTGGRGEPFKQVISSSQKDDYRPGLLTSHAGSTCVHPMEGPAGSSQDAPVIDTSLIVCPGAPAVRKTCYNCGWSLCAVHKMHLEDEVMKGKSELDCNSWRPRFTKEAP